MANRKVSIWLHVKTEEGWRYCRPVYGKNNNLKPWRAWIGGKEVHAPGAKYCLYYTDPVSRKRVWNTVLASQPIHAIRAAEYKQTYLNAHAVGLPIKDEARTYIGFHEALAPYLEEYKLSHRAESHALMEQTLYEFKNWVGRSGVNQLTRLDLLKYRQWLIEERKLSPRTAANKMLRAAQFHRAVMKLDPGKGLVTVKDARYVETEPVVYTDAELERFFNACKPNKFLTAVFRTLLWTGLRKAELESLTWDDIDFESGIFRVTPKPGFSPKDWEERSIECCDALLAILKELPRKAEWVFANGNGNRYTHMWDDCNELAKEAGIEAHPHKFRATYATTLLQNGMDLKTVQKLLGHKNLESTMRYLARAQSKQVRQKVNDIFGKPKAKAKSTGR
jgi:integrase/recombinase XerD